MGTVLNYSVDSVVVVVVVVISSVVVVASPVLDEVSTSFSSSAQPDRVMVSSTRSRLRRKSFKDCMMRGKGCQLPTENVTAL